MVNICLTSQVGRCHPLLLLPTVAEPNPDDLLLQLQRLGKAGDLLGGRLRTLVEVLLEGALDRHLDARPLFPLPPLRGYFVYVRARPRRAVRLRQPLL